MAVQPSDLHAIPLFHGITDEHLAKLLGACDRLELEPGTVLFEAGSEAKHFYLLTSGEVTLVEPLAAGGPSQGVRFVLKPVAPIGELGSVTGLRRNTTATVTQAAEVLRIDAGNLRQFFERHGDVAFPFYHNLLGLVADKLRRDTRHLDETRSNIIRTQRAMKSLLEHVLESEETALSKRVAETLEELIERNRKIHYVVEPASTLASWIRLDGGATVAVQEISDVHLRVALPPGGAPKVGSDFSGVLVLPGAEVPVSGEVETSDGKSIVVKLDLFITTYAAVVTDYLTRVQMLDFVV